MCSGPRPSSRSSPPLRLSPSSKPTVDSNHLVDRLAHLIRTEKLDLSVLLSNRPLAPRTSLASAPSPSPSAPPAPPPPRCPPRLAARGSHWSFLEKARFEAALHRFGPFAWDRIIAAVATRTEKQVKAYAARYRRRKRLAARMHALAVQQQQHQPPNTAPTPAGQHILPEPVPTIDPPHHLQRIHVPTPEALPVLAAASPPHTLLQAQPHPHPHPQLPLAPHPQPPQEWFASDFPAAFPDDHHSAPLFEPPPMYIAEDLLASPGQDTDLLSDDPSEFDLLVDRAIDGPVVLDDADIKPLVDDRPDFDKHEYSPADISSVWFKT